MEEKDAKKTKQMTKVATNAWGSWLTARGHKLDENTISKTELDALLYQFYFELRKQDGNQYSKAGFRGIRHGLQRHFKSIREFDIIQDVEFKRSGTAFTAQCVEMKKKGLARVKHKEPITEADMEKLYSSGVFDTAKPRSLQRKVFFELLYYFCRRAMENLRTLTKKSFVVKSDENGMEYVSIDIDEYEKNHGVQDDKGYEGGVMYATNLESCPVASFKKYVEKLNPSIDTFFQRPRSDDSFQNRSWYDAQVVGVKQLEKMMKTISLEAGLSQLYTNHCIRATCVTTLDDNGFEARHIMSVTGHKSESSIRAYTKTKLGTKRKMANALIAPTIKKSPPTDQSFQTATTPIPLQNQDYLRKVSAVKTFDFALRSAFDDEDDVDGIMSTLNLDDITPSTTTSQHLSFSSTPVRSTSCSRNFTDFFGGNTAPVFHNCSFNFN